MLKKLTEARSLFAIDSVGAFVSTISLGFILPYFNSYIGMPVNILYLLAFFAFCFLCHSFYHFYYFRENFGPKLRLVALINIAYCLLTLALLFYFKSEVSMLGKSYFIVEIILVVSLSIQELIVARNAIKAKV